MKIESMYFFTGPTPKDDELNFGSSFISTVRSTKRGAILTLEVPASQVNADLLYHFLKRKEKREHEHEQKE